MNIPAGLTDFKELQSLLHKHGCNPTKDQIILLGKVLYRLKQGSCKWQTTAKNLLKALYFHPLIANSAVFYNSIYLVYLRCYLYR